MSFAMDATVCKKQNNNENKFSRIVGAEETSNTGVCGFKVHVFKPIWFIIFTDFSDKHKHEVTYAHAVN